MIVAHAVVELFPVLRRMALVATCTKLAIMNVVTFVAAQTTAVERRSILTLWCRRGVATFAECTLMGTRQSKTAFLVVVKVPQWPRPCVMAGFATHSIPQFMFVLILVAGVAVAGCVFVTVCFVAALAWSHCVASREWETGH